MTGSGGGAGGIWPGAMNIPASVAAKKRKQSVPRRCRHMNDAFTVTPTSLKALRDDTAEHGIIPRRAEKEV